MHESRNALPIGHQLSGLTASSQSPAREAPSVPFWALAVGFVLVLVFAGMVIQTLSGRSLTSRLAGLVPGARSTSLTDDERQRVLYAAGPTVQIGQVGIGVRGQDRPFRAGDVVLLGSTRRIVRIEEGGHLTDLQGDEGASVQVSSLGAWDQVSGTLSGLPARYSGGAWTVQLPQLQAAGANLHVPGAPEEELTVGFQLVPPAGGRIRRFSTPAGPTVRIRPNGRMAALVIEGSDPLPTADNVAVTIQATVRATEGATMELALNDVVDAAATVQRTTDRRTATDEDEWLTLRVQRRVLFGSPADRYTIGLLEVRNRDWLEVRQLGVYLGVLP